MHTFSSYRGYAYFLSQMLSLLLLFISFYYFIYLLLLSLFWWTFLYNDVYSLLFISMKYIGTMLSVFQRHNYICQVIIWTPEGPISYASESLIVIFLPWYNCCEYVLNGNKMFLNWIELDDMKWTYALTGVSRGRHPNVIFAVSAKSSYIWKPIISVLLHCWV